MRFRRLAQSKGLADARANHPAPNRCEKILRGLEQLCAGSCVVEQRWTGEVERAALTELERRDGRCRTGGIAEAHHQAPWPQATERAPEGILADGIVYNVDAAAITGLSCRDPVVARRQHLVGTELTDVGDLHSVAHDGNHCRAQVLRPAHQERAYATSGSVHQDAVATANPVDLTKEHLRGQPASRAAEASASRTERSAATTRS